MISVSALTLLVWLALGCCILTPLVLLGQLVLDIMREELW